MFNHLTERLSQSINKIINKGRLTEKNIQETIREVRKALLEADVSLSVIKKFINNVKEKSIGCKINKSLTPGQEFIKIVKNELIFIMGEKKSELNLLTSPPAIILVIGLQGVGKTTSTAKIGRWIQNKYKKKILITSVDIYRAAAIKQLEILSNQAKIKFFISDYNKQPITISKEAVEYAQKNFYDILIIDTAGRLHINQNMMNELHQIQITIKPIETLLVVDSMMGQDFVNMAKIFNDSLLISGIVLTKTDGDTRSGVALSIRYITGKPIKFMGTGEKITDLEIFNPEKIANRILGMDDVISIIEDIEEKINQFEFQKITKKLKKGHNFDLNDFLIQIKQMNKIGGLNYFINKFSKNNPLFNYLSSNTNTITLNKIEAIIYSMTPKERKTPIIIKGSRKRRIASGSGTTVQDVNKLLKNFDSIHKIMKTIKTNGLKKIMRNIQNILPKNF